MYLQITTKCNIACKHAVKMYCDGNDGKTYHVGYIIAGLWLSLYEVTPFRKEC